MLSFYRFIVLSFYRFLLRNIEIILSFYHFIVSSFVGRKHRVLSLVYRFIALSFYRCKNIVLIVAFYRFIVAFYRFIVVEVNLETIL